MIETQRERRGHDFMPPADVLARIPALSATENTSFDGKTIWLHYFSPSSDHYVAELNPETGEAFGYARFAAFPDGAEWGYFDLAELEQVNVPVTSLFTAIVERDQHWIPRPFGLVRLEREEAGQ